MLGNLRVSTVQLQESIDAVDTAAATGAYIDVSNYDGMAIVVSQVGAVTSSDEIAVEILTATADDGTGERTVDTFTTVTSSNDPLTQAIIINMNGCDAYLAVKGTITGSAAAIPFAAHLIGTPKY